MPTTPAITKDLPLPVRIFHAAMEQQLSLADYAQTLGISADSLRAIVMAQLNHVEPAILDQLANVYQQSPETLRDHVWIAPPQESFAAWLKRNMEGISQHALRTRVQLDAKTLKRFLNAEMLPDSDQAERIARALYIDRREVARVVTANMVHQADAKRLVDPTSTSAEQRMPAPPVTAAPATVRSRRTRSQNATSNAEPAAAEGSAAIGAGVVAPALEGKHLPRATSPRQAGTQTVDATRKSVTGPEGDLPRLPVARRQPGAKTVAPLSAPTTTSPMDLTHESGAPRIERPRRPGARRPTDTTAAVSAPTLTVESTIDLVPAPEIDHRRQPASGRQASTTPAAASEITTTRPVGSIAHRDNPTVAATDSETRDAFKAPNQRVTRKQRRSGPVSKHGAADAAPPVIIPREVEVPASEGAVERDPASDTAPIATAAPVAVAQPTGLAMKTDAALPRTPLSDVNGPAFSTSDATAAPATAAIPPANTLRSAPPTANTTIALPPAAAAVLSVVAADTTTLQLTADEVRLIRHWRQLHPHGRRATLHYIGSLLVED
jgi:hypothetical protein